MSFFDAFFEEVIEISSLRINLKYCKLDLLAIKETKTDSMERFYIIEI